MGLFSMSQTWPIALRAGPPMALGQPGQSGGIAPSGGTAMFAIALAALPKTVSPFPAATRAFQALMVAVKLAAGMLIVWAANGLVLGGSMPT